MLRRIAVAALLLAASFCASPSTLHYASPGTERQSHYTLRLDGERLVLVDDATGAVLAQSYAQETTHAVIRGADGDHDDTLTVDFANGLSLAEGIDYDGGVGGWDTLRLAGTPSASVRSTAFNRSDGLVVAGSTEIRYRNLEPLVIAGPQASFVFTGTPGADAIELNDVGGGNLEIFSAGFTFEATTINASGTAMQILTGGGADTISMNLGGANRPSSLVLGDSGGGGVTFGLVPDTFPITVNGDPVGDDLVVDLVHPAVPLGPALSVTSVSGILSGTWTFADRATITFSGIASINPSDVALLVNAPGSALPGNDITYNIQVSNLGPNDAGSVALEDVLPAELLFVSITQTGGLTAYSCATPAGGASGTVSCDIGSLAAGTSASFDLVVQVDPAATSFTNTITATPATTDTNLGNNSVTPLTALSPTADMFADVVAGAASSPGGTQTFTLTVGNNGPSDALNGSFLFSTPLNTTLQSFTQDSGPVMTLNAPLGGNGTYSGSITAFPPGASAQFTVVLALDPMITSSVDVHLTALTSTTDSNASNNDSSQTVSLDENADIVVSASGTASAVAGTSITDTFTVTNNGPSAVLNTIVNYNTPGVSPYGGTTFVSGVPAVTNFEPALGNTGAISLTIPTLLSGQSSTFSVVYFIDPLQVTPLTSTYQAISIHPDPAPGNESASVIHAVTLSSDMTVTITGPATALPGSTVTYNITITNAGPSNADTVSFTDTLPAGMTVVDFSQDLSAPGTPAMSFTETSGSATAFINAFPAGQTAIWTLQATIASGFAGSLTNTGTITALTADPATGNNTASTTLTVAAGVNSFSGPSLGPIPGTITSTFSGGGGGCTFSSPQFLGPPPGAPPVPPTTPVPGIVFPFGLFDFSLAGCTAGSTVNFTITYPQAVPPQSTYWKYGPTASNPTPHWYVMPAAISGNTVTFSITDGGLGDDDLVANGQIVDQGGPGAGSSGIPSLSDGLLLALGLSLLAFGATSLRRRRGYRPHRQSECAHTHS